MKRCILLLLLAAGCLLGQPNTPSVVASPDIMRVRTDPTVCAPGAPFRYNTINGKLFGGTVGSTACTQIGGTGTIAASTANNVAFYTGATAIGGDPTLTWNNTTKQLGVGLAVPSGGATLQIDRANDGGVLLRLGNLNTNEFDFSRISATGALSIQGGQVGNNNIGLAPISGNVGIGTATPGVLLDVAGAARSQSLTVSNNTLQIVLGTTNTTTVTMAALTASRTFTLPDANSNSVQPLTCAAGNAVTAISAAGVLTCAASGTPGGADTNVQFNNAGAFGGSANLTWGNAAGLLTVKYAASNTLISTPVLKLDNPVLTNAATSMQFFTNAGASLHGTIGADFGANLFVIGTDLSTLQFTGANGTGIAAFGFNMNTTGDISSRGPVFYISGTAAFNSVAINSTGQNNAELQVSSTAARDIIRAVSGGVKKWALDSAGRPTTVTNASTTVTVCGTAPAILGNDYAGKVTTGSTATTSCLVTFASAFANAPYCTASNNSAVAAIQPVTTTTTMTLNYASATSIQISYTCTGG